MKESRIDCRGVRFSVERDGKEVGHAYLYLLRNDLHTVPFGLLEDVHVDERYRGQGIANELLATILERVHAESCYKLVATSRNNGTREEVHKWYLRLGFKDYGAEFRMDL
jgi:GNAT superfamily N-acetyltransferase